MPERAISSSRRHGWLLAGGLGRVSVSTEVNTKRTIERKKRPTIEAKEAYVYDPLCRVSISTEVNTKTGMRGRRLMRMRKRMQ